QFADGRFHLGCGLRWAGTRTTGAAGQPVQTLLAVPADPAMHRLTRYPEPLGDLGHRHPGLNLQHSAVPLLCHGQLHQHLAECHAGPDTDVSRRSRDRTLAASAFPYVFLDATYCKARVNRRVVSQAVVVATGVRADGWRE